MMRTQYTRGLGVASLAQDRSPRLPHVGNTDPAAPPDDPDARGTGVVAVAEDDGAEEHEQKDVDGSWRAGDDAEVECGGDMFPDAPSVSEERMKFPEVPSQRCAALPGAATLEEFVEIPQ